MVVEQVEQVLDYLVKDIKDSLETANIPEGGTGLIYGGWVWVFILKDLKTRLSKEGLK